MKALHRAALKRAYRTLAQGLGGSAVTTALVALLTDGRTAMTAAIIAVGTVVITAFGSFWQGVAQGLPEADGIAQCPEPGLHDPLLGSDGDASIDVDSDAATEPVE